MRVGIVDDMPMAREALSRVLNASGLEVAWVATGGAEAVANAARDRPDLILMDLVMPGTDGVQATRKIMAESPCPILVVTSSLTGHMRQVYEAMGHGALDAVETPRLGPRGEVTGASELLQKITTVGKLLGKKPKAAAASPAPPPRPRPAAEPMVAIGSSTGGPNALAEILAAFPKDLKARVVIIQHVDNTFAAGLARWLSERSGLKVELAPPGGRPEPGTVWLAATNDHLVLTPDRKFHYTPDPEGVPYRPSVDVFFQSLKAHWPEPGVAVLLTGMGRDGASGLLGLRQAGWATIAQDESSCVIWGMPKAAVEIGAAARVVPVHEIGPAVVAEVQTRAASPGATP